MANRRFEWNPFTINGEAPASFRYWYASSQRNWRIYQDDFAEPMSALATENTLAHLLNNTDIIRLRATLASLGTGPGSIPGELAYSLDSLTWTPFGALNEWNYANGKATEGDDVFSLLLTDSIEIGRASCRERV